ncbi:MAG: hypothetical protein JWN74_2446 [Acidobacteriaceae bacterium]|nr:hypothetical protein [Acidobacteriaceae bacterium]
MEDIGEAIVAVFVSILVSAISLLLFMVFVAGLIGKIANKLGLLSDEGAAWFGISFGIPVGIVFASVVFVYSFKKIRRYGRSE